jgi:hypothetical protein
MSSGSCRSTPGIRRALAPTGTLSTEIGNSMFYSKVITKKWELLFFAGSACLFMFGLNELTLRAAWRSVARVVKCGMWVY